MRRIIIKGMVIGIDGNEANQKNRVGIGQFAFNVIKEIERIDKKNEYIVYLKNNPLPDLPPERINFRYKVFGPGKLWTQIALPFKLFTQKKKPNIFFTPSHYAPRFSPVPTIVSIMDLWHHRHPEQFAKKDLYQLIKWEDYSVRNARHIITISEFSKKEILDIYKIPSEKITVAYPGFTKFQIPNSKTKIKKTLQRIKEKYKIDDDYLLYLGTLQPKKNIQGLIRAFSFLIANYRPPISLVIAGKKGWLYEKIFELVKELKLGNKIIFTGFVEEEEKPYLLAGAKAFVFPSFYEGFGIPVLEAFSLGVPVVCSNAGSLPEIGGESAIYCDPYSPESIARALEKVLTLKPGEKNEIIKAGFKRCQEFSWEKCSQKILEVLLSSSDER